MCVSAYGTGLLLNSTFQLNCLNDYLASASNFKLIASRITFRVSLHPTFLNLLFPLIFVQFPSNFLGSFLISFVIDDLPLDIVDSVNRGM